MQLRTQARVEKAFAAAEKLVLELGPEAVSIPDVALASGVPRASLYQFFANKYELLAQLAERYLLQVTELLRQGGQALYGNDWRTGVDAMIRAISGYYNATPIASVLLLGWPMSRETYQAQEVTLMHCGQEIHTIFLRLSPPLRVSPDICTLMTEMSFACLKHGYYRDGHISEETIEQAILAMTGYIEQLIEKRHAL